MLKWGFHEGRAYTSYHTGQSTASICSINKQTNERSVGSQEGGLSHGCGSHHLQDRSPAMHPLDPTCCKTCRRRHTAPVPCRKQDCPPPVRVYTAARWQERRKAVRGLTFGLLSTTTMASLLFPKAWTQHSSLWVPPPRLSGASDFPGSRPYPVDYFSGAPTPQRLFASLCRLTSSSAH